ncbi:hypothetical protein ABGN05_19675 [Aquibium sp. LZ166]|uniref:Uncharacterized protein n=1 Tax=Aquibium pacificus TaxID=3153579 RepID=A0ABV3SN21_9HYPH
MPKTPPGVAGLRDGRSYADRSGDIAGSCGSLPARDRGACVVLAVAVGCQHHIAHVKREQQQIGECLVDFPKGPTGLALEAIFVRDVGNDSCG